MPNRDVAIRLSLKDGDVVRRALMELGEDGQRALARIERQAKPASKSLLAFNQVTGEVRGSMHGFAARLGPVGAGLSALGPAGLAAGAGLGATVLAITGLIRAATNAATEIANIKDEAEQAGAAVETFQALRFAAEQYSVSQDALTDGLKELSLRADEFIETGGGSAEEAFRRLGFTQDELQEGLKDTGELFVDVLGRMKQLDDAARIRVADEIFGGTGGEQFVRLVGAGEERIRALMKQARELGLVLDEHLIRRADETRDAMNQASQVISVQLNSALVDLAPIALEVVKVFADLARWIGETVDGFRELEERSTAGLERRFGEVSSEIERLQTRINDGGGQVRGDRARHHERELARLRKERDEIARTLELRQELSGAGSGGSGGGGRGINVADVDKASAVIAKLERQIADFGRTEFGKELAGNLSAAGLEGQTTSNAQVERIRELTLARQTLAATEKQRQEDLKESQKLEQDGLALTARLRNAEEEHIATLAKLNELRDAGAITEQTYQRAIEESATKVEEAEARKLQASHEAADGIQRALESYSDDATNAAKNLEGVTTGSLNRIEDAFVAMATGAEVSFSNLVDSILADLIRLSIRQGLTGTLSGFLGDAFSSAFGFHEGGVVGGPPTFVRAVPNAVFDGAPRFHGGGYIGANEVPIIAEKGERILTMAQQDNTARTLEALAARGGGGVQFQIIDQRGAGAPEIEQSQRTGPNGERILVALIKETVNRGIGSGDYDQPLGRYFGLSRRGFR